MKQHPVFQYLYILYASVFAVNVANIFIGSETLNYIIGCFAILTISHFVSWCFKTICYFKCFISCDWCAAIFVNGAVSSSDSWNFNIEYGTAYFTCDVALDE